MFSKINWRSVFKSVAWVVCLGGLGVLMSFINVKKNSVNCTDISVLIPGSDNFIEREEIDAILRQSQGILIGKNLESVNLHEIEDRIKANPYIAFAKVYADMNGVISINIRQRQPILRVINSAGQDFYVDRNGLKMPISPNFTANVLVANGYIMEHFSGKVDTLITRLAEDLYQTALYVKRDTLWDAQVEQLFVNKNKDIEMIPRVGNQRIILGDADSLDGKMKNLLVFYKKIMPKVGWETYKSINIKYANQIVCERRDSTLISQKVSSPVIKTDSMAARKQTGVSAISEEIRTELDNALKTTKTDTRKNN